MVVSVSVCELHLPATRSLKDKRRVVRGLIDRIHKRYRVSIAETGFHDLHQRAEISLAVVGNGQVEAERMISDIRSMMESEPEAIVTLWENSWMEDPR
jgi:uncharacterized protein YlxP (DUF503 family)